MGPIVLQIIDQWYHEVLQRQSSSGGHFDIGDSKYTWQLSKHSSGLDLLLVVVSADEDSGPVLFEVAEVLAWLNCVFCKKSSSGLQNSGAPSKAEERRGMHLPGRLGNAGDLAL